MIEDPQILFRYMDQGFFPTNSIWETQMEGLRWNLTDAPPLLFAFFVTFWLVYHPVFGQDFHFLDHPMILKMAFRDFFTSITNDI